MDKIVRYGIFTTNGRHHRIGMRWYRSQKAAIDRAKALFPHYPKRGLVVEQHTFTVNHGGSVTARQYDGTVFRVNPAAMTAAE